MASFTTTIYSGSGMQLANNSASYDTGINNAPSGGIYLYASGAIGAAKLYLQNEYVASGSAVSVGDLGGGIDTYTNPANNRVITSIDSNGINAEANLSFNGSALMITGSVHVADDKKLFFGTNDDASIEYDENDTNRLIISGSTAGIAVSGTTYFANSVFIAGVLGGASPLEISGGVGLGTHCGDSIYVSGTLTASCETLFKQGTIVQDDQKAYFGTGRDAYIEYDEDGRNKLIISGSVGGIEISGSTSFNDTATFEPSSGNAITVVGSILQLTADSTLKVGEGGASEKGAEAYFYGAADGEYVRWRDEAASFMHYNSSDVNYMNVGSDTTSEYAIDVANGANNQNKIRAAAFVTYSDEELKEDVAPMTNALSTIKSLKGVDFTWKDSGERDFGFIAQQLEKVIPAAVHDGDRKGYKGVDYSRITSVLVEAVKEQQKQIEELKEKLKE